MLKLSNPEKQKNIDPGLRGYLQLLHPTIIKHYGKFINNRDLAFKLKHFSMSINNKENDPHLLKNLGYFSRGERKLVIRDDLSEAEKITVFCHEYLHLTSSNRRDVKNEEGTKFRCDGLFMLREYGTEELGEGINEGITQMLAEKIVNEHGIYEYKSNKKFQIYEPLVKIANLLYSIVGEKVLEAYFKGNPFLLIKEFDQVLGKGAWKCFAIQVDEIYYNKEDIFNKSFDVRPFEEEANRLLLRYFWKKQLQPWLNTNLSSSRWSEISIEDYFTEVDKVLTPIIPFSNFELEEKIKFMLNEIFIHSRLKGSYSEKEQNEHLIALTILQNIHDKGIKTTNLNNCTFQTIPELSSNNKTVMIMLINGQFKLFEVDIPAKGPDDWEDIPIENLNNKKDSELTDIQKIIKKELIEFHKPKTTLKTLVNRVIKKSQNNLEILTCEDFYPDYIFVNDRINNKTYAYRIEIHRKNIQLHKVALSKKQKVAHNERHRAFPDKRPSSSKHLTSVAIKNHIRDLIKTISR